MQPHPSHDVGHAQGDKAGQKSEDQELVRFLFDAFRVHLQSGEEHDIIKAHASQDLERHVTFENVETIMADDDTCQHHADDVGDAQFTHDDRGEENDEQHHEEDQRGVGNGEICCHQSHFVCKVTIFFGKKYE